MRRPVTIGIIVCCSLVVTSLGIGAADTWQGNSGSLLGQLIGADIAVCPAGMVQVATAQTFTCVDTYEVSADVLCPHSTPTNALDTAANLAEITCAASSKPDVAPWRFVTREEAALACARAGKRLPTAAEWYTFALGTPAEQCNVRSGSFVHSGASPACLSAAAVHDAVGNVWEWVSDDVIAGVYQGRPLPSSGYVTQVDAGGVGTETNPDVPSEQFASDYLWSAGTGAYGMIRGGFYGSKDDAGVYTVQAQTLPTFAGGAIGFRCVQ